MLQRAFCLPASLKVCAAQRCSNLRRFSTKSKSKDDVLKSNQDLSPTQKAAQRRRLVKELSSAPSSSDIYVQIYRLMTLGQHVTMDDGQKVRAIDVLAKAVELSPSDVSLCLELALIMSFEETVCIDSKSEKKWDKIELFHHVAELEPRLLPKCCELLSKAVRDASLAHKGSKPFLIDKLEHQTRAQALLLRGVHENPKDAAALMHLIGLPGVKYPISLLDGTVVSKLDLCLRAIELQPWHHAPWAALFRAAPEGSEMVTLLNGKVISKDYALKHGSRLLNLSRIVSGQAGDVNDYFNLIRSLDSNEKIPFPDGKEYGQLQIALLAVQNGIRTYDLLKLIFQLADSDRRLILPDETTIQKKDLVCQTIEREPNEIRLYDLLAQSVDSLDALIDLFGKKQTLRQCLADALLLVDQSDTESANTVWMQLARLLAADGAKSVQFRNSKLTAKDIFLKFALQNVGRGENMNNLACCLADDEFVEVEGRRLYKADLWKLSIQEQCSMACVNLLNHLEKQERLDQLYRRQLQLQAFEFDPTTPMLP